MFSVYTEVPENDYINKNIMRVQEGYFGCIHF